MEINAYTITPIKIWQPFPSSMIESRKWQEGKTITFKGTRFLVEMIDSEIRFPRSKVWRRWVHLVEVQA